MRTTNHVWKRLLSLALATVMLLGYVPAKASAAEEPTETLLTAEITDRTEEVEVEDTANPGTMITMHTYVITVKDKDGIDVTDSSTIAWTGAPDGFTGPADEATYGPIPDGADVSATVTRNGLVLKNVKVGESTWSFSIANWADITAGETVKGPEITPVDDASFESDPQWKITYKDSEKDVSGTAATVGELIATTTIGGEPYEKRTNVVAAPIKVTSVSPKAGWYTKIPEVTVSGSNNTDLDNSVGTIDIGGEVKNWEETGEGDQKYSVTFTPVQGREYTIGDTKYTWNVDDKAEVKILAAVVRENDSHAKETFVVYSYAVGPSGGTLTIGETSMALQANASANGETIVLPGALETVTAKIVNGAGATNEPKPFDGVIKFPEAITISGTYLEKENTLYVPSGEKLTFSMPRAYGDVTWSIKDSANNEIANSNELVASDYKTETLTVTAEDSRGRSRNRTLTNITVDSEAPTINIQAVGATESFSENGTETFADGSSSLVCHDRAYNITAQDNVELENCTAVLFYSDGSQSDIIEVKPSAKVEVAPNKTLTKIEVTATDWSGIAKTVTLSTNVTTDTTSPVINGIITATAGEETLKISGVYVQGEGEDQKIYLKLENVVANEDGVVVDPRDVTVSVSYEMDDANSNEIPVIDPVTVKLNSAGELPLSLSGIADLAGNPANHITIKSGDIVIVDADISGSYTGSVHIDRRNPEDAEGDPAEPPKITLSLTDPNVNKAQTEGEWLFNGNFTVTVSVKDADSGLQTTPDGKNPQKEKYTYKIAYEIDGEKTEETIELQNGTDGTVGEYTVEVPAGKDDANCSVELKVYDNVGNYYLCTKTFAVDSKLPEVTINGAKADEFKFNKFNEENPEYSKEVINLTFAMTDTHLESATIKCSITNLGDGKQTTKDVSLNATETSKTITLEDGEKLTGIQIIVVDGLGNKSDKTYDLTAVVDTTLPAITIHKPVAVSNGAELTPVTKDGVDYYGESLKLFAEVWDLNLKTAECSYTMDEGTNLVKLALKNNEKTEIVSVTGGHTLHGFTVTAEDKATNPKDDSYKNRIAVDADVPQVKVTRTVETDKKHIQTVDGKAYYNGQVTFTIEIKDQFIDLENTAVKAVVDGVETDWTDVKSEKTSYATTSLTGNIVLKDGQTLESITIVAKDMYERNAAEVLVDADVDFKFDKKDGTFTYNGPKVVVDKTNPEATLQLTGDINLIQIINNTYYVTLNSPVEGNNDGTFTGSNEEEVSLTLTVKDPNLALNVGDAKLVNDTYPRGTINGNDWTIQPGKAVCQAIVKVPIHGSGVLTINAAAFDLAGNAIDVTNVIWASSENGANEGGIQPLIEKTEETPAGTVQGTFSVDRRTPSTTQDVETPEIKLSDYDAPKFKTLSGMDLYRADFNFKVSVTDSRTANENPENYAGLNKVVTVLSDEVGTVVKGGQESTYKAEKHQLDHSEDVSVKANGQGETDNAILNVTATDNVGNTIHYFKKFAFDNQAPRVNVVVSGTSVRGNKYYNQTRTATVTITDLHMPAIADFGKYVTVTTQVPGSGWVKNGNTYTNTYTFSNDGAYTFSIQAKDLAGNTTPEATYQGENPQDFVVDQTRPEITVLFNPANPSGRDDKNVDYYAEDVTASVTINERNFSVADVVAKFEGIDGGLGNWTGDVNHKSSVTFNEGNNYSFSIEFVDLAGNRADGYRSPTFSVDLTAPTVTISKGTLKNDGLNIIQGDLNLAISVNDAQKNLSDYTVTVTKLSNNFKSEEVSGKDYYTVSTVEDRTTVTVDFEAIAREKGNDGIYTVKVSAKDYAGNSVNLAPDLQFSLNRFGSTFTTNDSFTEDFLTIGQNGNVYHSSVDGKLVIQEINPNMVWQDSSKKKEGSTLTVVVNGTSTLLEEGKHYTMTRTQEGTGDNTWYVYSYAIDPNAFRTDGAFVDGRYSILVYGEDDAGNKNTNESNEYGTLQKNADGEYTGKIEFTLDTTAPIITTTGVEDRKTYNEEFRRMNIFLSDNSPYQIAVYLNDTLVEFSESAEGLVDSQAWLVWDETVGGYVLNVPEQNTLFGDQNVRVVATDAAGNAAEHNVEEFHISTNLFVRLFNSTWFIVALLLALILAAGLVILLLIKRRRKANV